jgi:hypothetical protein
MLYPSNPVVTLLNNIMTSTHTLPQRYKISRMRYDPTPIAERNFGKVYKARDLDVCVNMITNPDAVSVRVCKVLPCCDCDIQELPQDVVEYLAFWAHVSHPNIVPFYGVFHDDTNEIPQFCLLSPHLKNGVLHDYAPLLPQQSRIPLVRHTLTYFPMKLTHLSLDFRRHQRHRILAWTKLLSLDKWSMSDNVPLLFYS